MQKKIIFLVNCRLIKNFIYRNKSLINKYKKNFSTIIIINFYKSKFINKDKRIKIINIKKYSELVNFLKINKNYLYVSYIETNFQNLFKFFILKLYGINFFEIYCTGDIKNYKIYFNRSVIRSCFKIYYIFNKSVLFLIYNIFSKIGIIQKPLFLIHVFSSYQEQVFSSFDNLIENNFNIFLLNFLKFFKIKYYDKIYLIDKPLINFKKKDIGSYYIVFIDSCFDHNDREVCDRPASNFEKILYYNKLSNFFLKIEKIFKMKVIFLKHPDTEITDLKNNLKHIRIINNNTEKYLMKSKLVFFHESSVVVTALMLKKKIVNLRSKYMGEYFKFRNNIYSKKLDIPSINIDKNISLLQIRKKVTNLDIKYKKYFDNLNTNKVIERYDINKLIYKLKFEKVI